MPKTSGEQIEQRPTEKKAAHVEDFPDAYQVSTEKRPDSNHPGKQWTAKIIDCRVKLMTPQVPGNPDIVHAVNIDLMKTHRPEPDELKTIAQRSGDKDPPGNVPMICQKHPLPISSNRLTTTHIDFRFQFYFLAKRMESSPQSV